MIRESVKRFSEKIMLKDLNRDDDSSKSHRALSACFPLTGPWLQKSIALTSASGRTRMLLAAAYQQLGRIEEAGAAMREGTELWPGSTYGNVPTPTKNSSPINLPASSACVMRSG